jgi:hypothetical protein
VVVHESADCLTVEAGGAIPHRQAGPAEHRGYGTYTNPYLHRHNWLNGSIVARLHRNGVCEIVARHVNTKFVDDGKTLDDVVPVVGFRAEDPVAVDGQVLRFGAVAVGVDEVGTVASDADWTVWQPFAGVEVLGGLYPTEVFGHPFLFRARDRVFPRGMARSLRFTLSLGDRPPSVARYLAPDWWYGLCGELSGRPLLPVGVPDAVRTAVAWVRGHQTEGGFEDGTVPRHHAQRFPVADGVRYEPGWEGELPYGMFLTAWRTGDGDLYQRALRAAYATTDIGVNHAANLMRMHGHPDHALSLPMTRMLGTIAAYLETGDPFLLRTAKAVTDTAHATHLASWPRLAVGRDACYLRGAAMLYRYLGDEHYLDLTFEGAVTVAQSQRADGAFGDQGGGVGLHGWNAYITKPWMGLLALGGVLDYLDLRPGTQPLHDAVLRFGDWLLANYRTVDGHTGWSYQYDYDGRPEQENFGTGTIMPLPTPPPFWHHDTLARLLGYCTLATGDPRYVAAWRDSYLAFWRRAAAGEWVTLTNDHVVSSVCQFVPWLYDRLWRVGPDGVADPAMGAAELPGDSVVSTSDGAVRLSA